MGHGGAWANGGAREMSTPPPPPTPSVPQSPSAPSAGTFARAQLADKSGGIVIFNFNPQKITISHSARRKEQGEQASSDDHHGQPTDKSSSGNGTHLFHHVDSVAGVGATSIAISDLLFDGNKAADNCAQLLTWSYPQPAKPQSGATQDLKTAEMTALTFTWGSPISYTVTIFSVDISYERFSPTGVPIRAKANLKLQSLYELQPSTNPTSGGISGRRSHTLVAGENLQHVAMASYGRPGAWRALAAANGIEDPLAVQPGTVIYLPAPTELADGAAR